jgi:hypothetical protein
MKKQTPFIITIDTEGDNLWSKPNEISTENSKYLPRFQKLCEKFGLKPVYLTNWEMANCEFFKEFARDVIRRNTGEIGMHLHAWNSPPHYELKKENFDYQSFLIEYPENIMRKKIEIMTRKLEDTFQVSMLSHRSGRWAINNTYLKILKEFGYKIDCSITPLENWGLNNEQYSNNNIDYSNSIKTSYFVDEDILVEGESDFLEVPVSIIKNTKNTILRKYINRNRLTRRIYNHYRPEILWLRPNGKNLNNLIQVCDDIINNNSKYAEFILHSSELMPGGSPNFKDEKSIEKLYEDLEKLFEYGKKFFYGQTLSEFYNNYNL